MLAILIISLSTTLNYAASVQDVCGTPRKLTNVATYQEIETGFKNYTDVTKWGQQAVDTARDINSVLKSNCIHLPYDQNNPGINKPCVPTDIYLSEFTVTDSPQEFNLAKDMVKTKLKEFSKKVRKSYDVFKELDTKKELCKTGDKDACDALITGIMAFIKTTDVGKKLMECVDDLPYKAFVDKSSLPLKPACMDMSKVSANAGGGFGFGALTSTSPLVAQASLVINCDEFFPRIVVSLAHELFHACNGKDILMATADLRKARGKSAAAGTQKPGMNIVGSSASEEQVLKEALDRANTVSEIKVVQELEIPLFKEMAAKYPAMCNEMYGGIIAFGPQIYTNAELYYTYEKLSAEALLPQQIIKMYVMWGGFLPSGLLEMNPASSETRNITGLFKRSANNSEHYVFKKEMLDLLDKNNIKVHPDNRG